MTLITPCLWALIKLGIIYRRIMKKIIKSIQIINKIRYIVGWNRLEALGSISAGWQLKLLFGWPDDNIVFG
jgi:hypothetical protein